MYEEYYANQLRHIREHKGLTLQEMADVLHTSKQVLSRYETGQRTPKISVANEFATILNVPLSYFFPDAPTWREDVMEDWQNARSDEERLAIVKAFGLDPRVYDEYLTIQDERSPLPPPFRVSDHERDLILAYRAQPHMQEAVDRLLQLPAAQPLSKQA